MRPRAEPTAGQHGSRQGRGPFFRVLSCLPSAHYLSLHFKHGYYDTFYFTGKICMKNPTWLLRRKHFPRQIKAQGRGRVGGPRPRQLCGGLALRGPAGCKSQVPRGSLCPAVWGGREGTCDACRRPPPSIRQVRRHRAQTKPRGCFTDSNTGGNTPTRK